jgi:PAS domain-containing protein
MTAESAEGLRALAALQRRRLWLPTATMFSCSVSSYGLPKFVNCRGYSTAGPIRDQGARGLIETGHHCACGDPTISNLIRDINDAVDRGRTSGKRRKYRSYIADAPDGIFVVDAAGHYLEDRPQSLFHDRYTEDDSSPMSLTDLIWPICSKQDASTSPGPTKPEVGGEYPTEPKTQETLQARGD